MLVPEELDNDYWRLVEKGAKAAAKELGVDLEYIGPRQANIDEHLRILKKRCGSESRWDHHTRVDGSGICPSD